MLEKLLVLSMGLYFLIAIYAVAKWYVSKED